MHGGRKRRPQRQQMRRRPSHLPPRTRRWRHLVPVPTRKSWPKRRKVKLLSSEGREWTYMHTPFCVCLPEHFLVPWARPGVDHRGALTRLLAFASP